MQLMEFTYTKSPTDVSRRVFIPLSVPSNKYFGIDVSDLDVEDQAFVMSEIELIEEEKQTAIAKVMEKYDIRTQFRSFLEEKMSGISYDA